MHFLIKKNSIKQIIKIGFLCITSTLSSLTLSASFPNIGDQFPEFTISQSGELILNEDKTDTYYQAWNSANLKDKYRVVMHIAGRTAAKKINQPLIEAIKNEKFDQTKYQTTTIINRDDILFGTSKLVKMTSVSKKKEFPYSSIVMDRKGMAKNTLVVKEKSSAVFVLDTEGKVLFAKDGKLSDIEIDQVIGLISKATIN